MPFGIHKGKKLANIPADYLMWCYRNDRMNAPLKLYIEENKGFLEMEEKEILRKKKRDNKELYK
jgi:hypothetical protein